MLMPTPNTNPLPPSIQRVIDDLHRHLGACSATVAAEKLIRSLHEQLYPQPLIVDINHNTMTRAGVVVVLSPNQAVLMKVLSDHFPLVAPLHELGLGLWGRNVDNRNINTIRVMMSDLRRVSTSVKAKIQNENKVGYRLELLPI